MIENLGNIKNIVLEFKRIEEEEQKLCFELYELYDKFKKIDTSYIKTTNKIQKNNIIIEVLDSDLNYLKEVRDKVIGYKEFAINKKRNRILQTIIVMGISGLLSSPLIVINIIVFLEVLLLGVAIIGLSNTAKYFNDIRSRKELVKSTDINKLGSDINKKERQKEIAECTSVKLDVKNVSLANEIENLHTEKKRLLNQLEYLFICKKNLIGELSKEFNQTKIEDSNQLSKDVLGEAGSCLKLE